MYKITTFRGNPCAYSLLTCGTIFYHYVLRKMVAHQLVKIAKFRCFEGWLPNIANEIKSQHLKPLKTSFHTWHTRPLNTRTRSSSGTTASLRTESDENAGVAERSLREGQVYLWRRIRQRNHPQLLVFGTSLENILKILTTTTYWRELTSAWTCLSVNAASGQI